MKSTSKIVTGIVGGVAVLAVGGTAAFNALPKPNTAMTDAPSTASVVSIASSDTISTVSSEVSSVPASSQKEASSAAQVSSTRPVSSKAPVASQTSSAAAKHMVTIEKKEIAFKFDTGTKNLDGSVKYGDGDVRLWGVDSTVGDAFLIIDYSGHFSPKGNEYGVVDNLRPLGFIMKNGAGEPVGYTTGGFCKIKVPYTNLSDISTLYFMYGGDDKHPAQQIKITVS